MGVVGSTSFNDYEFLKRILNPYLNLYKTKLILVSGGAPGADKLGENWANENNIEKDIYYADWYNLSVKPCKIKKNKKGKLYNVLAGFNRNKEIVNNSDIIIAFWNGQSPGTEDTINYARSKGIEPVIHYFIDKF